MCQIYRGVESYFIFNNIHHTRNVLITPLLLALTISPLVLLVGSLNPSVKISRDVIFKVSLVNTSEWLWFNSYRFGPPILFYQVHYFFNWRNNYGVVSLKWFWITDPHLLQCSHYFTILYMPNVQDNLNLFSCCHQTKNSESFKVLISLIGLKSEIEKIEILLYLIASIPKRKRNDQLTTSILQQKIQAWFCHW